MIYSAPVIARHPKTKMPKRADALPGRPNKVRVPENHHVSGHRIVPPFPENLERAMFGLGCFWGAERKFWQREGVYSTAAGYAAGFTPNPTYKEICSGRTGHNEVVLVLFQPEVVSYDELLVLFF
jgi:peptide-methionine (S)-S-oxide reductase